MLWSIWKQGSSLDIAGYGQQDCHEWLVAVSFSLNAISRSVKRSSCVQGEHLL